MGTGSGQVRRVSANMPRRIEWPTFALWCAVVTMWSVAVFGFSQFGGFLAFAITVLALVLHSSLSHEVCHGHPFRSRLASEALVSVNPGLFIPYPRFRDTHLAHHLDARLTDPYDDPESNYLDPIVWDALPNWKRWILGWNNTLFGRMLVGPIVGQVGFMSSEWNLIKCGETHVLKAWIWHLLGVAAVICIVMWSAMPLWSYCLAAYVALSILKIRTFLEHQAHERARGRTVIIEDKGPLSFLFLNNNLHVVHHMHPRVPWYNLPSVYAQSKARYQKCNAGYVYRSYAQVFRYHFLKAKDPVAHPLWQRTR